MALRTKNLPLRGLLRMTRDGSFSVVTPDFLSALGGETPSEFTTEGTENKEIHARPKSCAQADKFEQQ
jgi:hypothetical protein